MGSWRLASVLLLILFIPDIKAGVLTNRNGLGKCVTHCRDQGPVPRNFQYELGSYLYQYTFSQETLVLHEKSPKATLNFTSKLLLHVGSECEWAIQFKDVELTEALEERRDLILPEIKESLQKYPTKLGFHDGHIDLLCPHEDETRWVTNIKRGVLSLFQNSFGSKEGNTEETDVNGKCRTSYGVSGEEEEVERFLKVKDFASCTQRRGSLSTVQGAPYSVTGGLLEGGVKCSQTRVRGIYSEVECEEEQVFKPFEQSGSGARQVVRQSLVLRERLGTQGAFNQDYSGIRKTTLVFEPDHHSEITSGDTKNVLNLLKDFQADIFPIESEAPLRFQELVEGLRSLNVEGLKSLLLLKEHEELMMNALPLVNTPASVTLLAELFQSDKLRDDVAQSWLTSVAFIKYPTEEMLQALLPILEKTQKPEVLLSVSAMINSYCKTAGNCEKNDVVEKAIEHISQPLSDDCKFANDKASIRRGMIALKALGNLGQPVDKIRKCYASQMNPLEIRFAAVDAHRRMPCDFIDKDAFLGIYSNHEEKSELRIQAYLMLMQCVDRRVLENVKIVLQNEVSNQVGSFVWTHLTNLQETERPDKELIKKLVENDEIPETFDTDPRKFSRNYESSIFSEKFKAGGGIDANVIFTEDSFIPRFASANLSLQMLGETVNLLEFGGRLSSPETLLRPLFGPDGYFPDDGMGEFKGSNHSIGKRESVSEKVDRSVKRIHALTSQRQMEEPSSSFFLRVFGHEILYKEFRFTFDSILPNAVDENGKKWLSMRAILDNLSTGKKTKFTRSMVLADVDYSVPTTAGIPLSLRFQVGSTLGLTAEGRFNVGKFMEKKEVDVYGLFRPNLVVNLEASLTSGFGPQNNLLRTGLSIRNVVRSSTAIETRVEVQGKERLKAELNLPQQKQILFEAESKVVFRREGREEVLSVPEAGKYEYSTCFGDKSFLGLQLCGGFSVPRSFTPVPLQPAKASLFFDKSIDFEGVLVEYSLKREGKKRELTVTFDTPGTRVSRKTGLSLVTVEGEEIRLSLSTPETKLDASGKYGMERKSLEIVLVKGSENLLQLNASLDVENSRIKPNIFLSVLNQPRAGLEGAIKLPTESGDQRRAEIDIYLKHITETPARLQGNFIGRRDGSEVSVGVESSYLNGKFLSAIKSRPHHWSSKSSLEYSWKNSNTSRIDVSAKLQKAVKGALAKYSAAAGLTISQFPESTIDFSWETLASAGFCENTGKLAIGKSKWDTHTIYNWQNNPDISQLRLLFALANLKDEVDYHLELFHRKVPERSLRTRFIGRTTPNNEFKGEFMYDTISTPLLQHNLSVQAAWPGQNYAFKSTLLEKRRGAFNGEVVVNMNDFKEMKATATYINNSTNLRLDHWLEFRARGFLSYPVSGDFGFTVTDSQSHVGCQVQLEGRAPYSTRIGTSLDYSRVRNAHKFEGKVTFNERKYNAEVVFTQKKSGIVHLLVNANLTNHIIVEGKFTPFPEASVIFTVVPDNFRNPDDRVELQGTLGLDERKLDLYFNYFGEKVNCSGGFGEGEGSGLILWGKEGKMINGTVVWSQFSSQFGQFSGMVETPFEGYEELFLGWKHELTDSQVEGDWEYRFGRKWAKLGVLGRIDEETMKASGTLRVSEGMNAGFNLEGTRSNVLDRVKLQAEYGTDQGSTVVIEYGKGHVKGQITNVLMIQEATLHLSGKKQETFKSGQVLLVWDIADSERKEFFGVVEQDLSRFSYSTALSSSFPEWTASNAVLIWNEESSAYNFLLVNQASLPYLPRRVEGVISGNLEGFNYSAVYETSENIFNFKVAGHVGGLNDTKVTGELKLNSNQYIYEVITSTTVEGFQRVQLLQEKADAGLEISPEPPKRISLLLSQENSSNNLNLQILDGKDAVLLVDGKLLLESLRFWNFSLNVDSNTRFLPSLSVDSVNDMKDLRKVVILNNYKLEYEEDEDNDESGVDAEGCGRSLIPRTLKSSIIFENFDQLAAKLILDEVSTVKIDVVKAEEGIYSVGIASTFFDAIEGNLVYQIRSEQNDLTFDVQQKAGKIVDVKAKLLKGEHTEVKLGVKSIFHSDVELHGYYKKKESVTETYMTYNGKHLLHLKYENNVAAHKSLLKLESKSFFFPTLNNVNLEAGHELGPELGLKFNAKFANAFMLHRVSGTGSWNEEKSLKVQLQGDLEAGLEVALEGTQVRGSLTQKGRKLGEAVLTYVPHTAPKLKWGKHQVTLLIITGQGVSNQLDLTVGADPKRFDITLTTPFQSWNKFRVFWTIDFQASAKLLQFGVHKDSDKLEGKFDMRHVKRGDGTTVQTEFNIVGFKVVRQLIFGEEESDWIEFDGKFSSLAKWAPGSVELTLAVPFERVKNVKFTGDYENKKGQKSFGITCNVDGRQHGMKGFVKLPGKKVEIDFEVQCLNKYKSRLEIDYGAYKTEGQVSGPSFLWKMNGQLGAKELNFKATTPFKGWEEIGLKADYDRKLFPNGTEKTEGKVQWSSGNADISKKELGFVFRRGGNQFALLLATPIHGWEESNITLAFDQPLKNILVSATKSDGQHVRVDINTTTVGELESNGSLLLDIKIESSFEELQHLDISTKYSRVFGEHQANVECLRKDGVEEEKNRYIVSGEFKLPDKTQGGKLVLALFEGVKRKLSEPSYTINAEVSPLSDFSLNMEKPVKLKALLTTPYEYLSFASLDAEVQMKGRVGLSILTNATLKNESIVLDFDYKLNNGNPKVRAKVQSPFNLYEEIEVSLGLETVRKGSSGSGHGLHVNVMNSEWANPITMDVDYSYKFLSFVNLQGELNAVMNFMDIPEVHWEIKTTAENGYYLLTNGQFGTWPGFLLFDVQMEDGNFELLLNGTVGDTDDSYGLFTKSHFISTDEVKGVGLECQWMEETVLNLKLESSSERDHIETELFAATPLGPVQLKSALSPASLFLGEEFEFQRLFALERSRAVVDFAVKDEKLVRISLQKEGSESLDFEVYSQLLLPISLVLKASPQAGFETMVCWDLEEPVGKTLGAKVLWELEESNGKLDFLLHAKEAGFFSLNFLNKRLDPLLVENSLLTEWQSPLFDSTGKLGYHLSTKRDDEDNAFSLVINLPWRSFLIESESQRKLKESSYQAKLQWGDEGQRLLTLNWQQVVEASHNLVELSDSLELGLGPLLSHPVSLSWDRIYKSDKLHVLEVLALGSSSEPFTLSVAKHDGSWRNFRFDMRHVPSNVMVALHVKSDEASMSSQLALMDSQGLIRNVSMEGSFRPGKREVQIYSPQEKGRGIRLRQEEYLDSEIFSCQLFSYEGALLVQKGMPFLELNIKRKGEQRFNLQGGFLTKRTLGAHIAEVQGESVFTYFVKGKAELLGGNEVITRLDWQPDFFRKVVDLEIPRRISQTIWADLNDLEIVSLFSGEFSFRWKQQLSPLIRNFFLELKNGLDDEIGLVVREFVDFGNKVKAFYDENRLYVKDLLCNFEFLAEFVNSVWTLVNDCYWSSYSFLEKVWLAVVDIYEKAESLDQLGLALWNASERLLEQGWELLLNLGSSLLDTAWDLAHSLLRIMKVKVEELERRLLAAGFFLRVRQFYTDYISWIEEIPIKEVTKRIDAVMKFRAWEKIRDYLRPLWEALFSGDSLQNLWNSPTVVFLRKGISSFNGVIRKVWKSLEVEEKIKLLVKASLHNLNRFLHRYIPTAHYDYNVSQGWAEYNQSLSALYWSDWTQAPHWKGVQEEANDVAQFTNFYYRAADTVKSLLPLFELKIRHALPPFGAHAIMAGDHHFVTFDHKYFRHTGECSYLLVLETSADLPDPFALIVNYENWNGSGRKKSYTILNNGSRVDIEVVGLKVTVDGRKVELPLEDGNLFVQRHQSGLEIADKRGFGLRCSLTFSVCTVEVSGWHFGQIGGMLGSYDYENFNDFQGPEGRRYEDVAAFAHSWSLGGQEGCRMKNLAKNETHPVQERICADLLTNMSSPLRPCFNTVESSRFLEMCEYDVARHGNAANRVQAVCTAMNAYVTECQKNNVDIWVPPPCVRCKLEDATVLSTGETVSFQSSGERPPPKSADNVVLLDENSCFSTLLLEDAVKRLDLALQLEGLSNNRYAVVGFGGGRDPYVRTLSSSVWTHSSLFRAPNVSHIEPMSSSGELYSAIEYADKLGFRAGVAKNFIAVSCELESEHCGVPARYHEIISILLDKDIRLHLLVSTQFKLKGNKKPDETNQIFGVDMQGAYSMKNAKSGMLEADKDMKKHVQIPKDFCTPLAMESNGTRFFMDEKKMNKRVLDVWARRVALTSYPSECQRCECIPNRFGSSTVKCQACVPPRLKVWMDEWESVKALNGDEFVEFPDLELLDHSDFALH